MYFQSCLATMSGALISKVTKQWRRGLVCPSLMRKLSRRSSFSPNSLDSLAKDALAAFTTLRSDPMKSTSRTYPLSSTGILKPIKECGLEPSIPAGVKSVITPHPLCRRFLREGVAFDPVITDDDFELQFCRLRRKAYDHNRVVEHEGSIFARL